MSSYTLKQWYPTLPKDWKVDMYSKDGQLLKSFPSAKAAADHVGVGGSSVQWACLHNSNCKNFKFKYNAE